MKLQRAAKIKTSLKTLGIIFLTFFAMAFSCSDDPPIRSETTRAGGLCTTENEFRNYIIYDKTYLAKDYEKVEVIFNTFKVGAPRHYENIQGTRWDTVTDSAYPVNTSFDTITRGDSMGTSKIYRSRYVDVSYMCYVANWTQGETCVCFAEKNPFPVTEREEITEEDY